MKGIPLLLLIAGSALAGDPGRPRIDLVKDAEPAYIVLAKAEHKGVMAAARDLQRDITKIAGVTPNIVHALDEAFGKCVVLGSANCPEGRALLASVGVPVADLAGKWEVFKHRVVNGTGRKDQVLAIAGSDVRGTIFGIYDFEQKHLGIDPLWFWADHEPATRGELIFDDRIDFGPCKEPTWKYRGWTLNDHPQFMEWLQSGLVQRTRYSRYMFAIHPEILERIWEAALRLKMNMFTWYFVDIDWQPDRERLQAAVDRGLFITQHQMEGVGANTGYWDTYWAMHNPLGKPKEFSYKLHPDAFREFWSSYIRRWAEFSPQVVWEINLRGWADGPYEESSLPDGGTPRQRAEIISAALADQAQLVRKLDPNPQLEMMTSLYAEMGKFYDEGWIQVPPGVTTGFCDAGMNGMSYSKKFWTEPRDRQRRYGQYFHTQYFGGGPQIAKCTPIETYLKVNMDAMFQRGDTQHMLLAMNELRHQQLEIRGIAEMLWDYPGFKPREYLARYCREEFGEAAAGKVAVLYDAYYAAYPHTTKNDGFKTIPMYHKVMEPLFTVIANLHNIEAGTRDGLKFSYSYKREAYEAGIRGLGELLDRARALRAQIPENRRYFFDYEFIDAIRLIRGIYKLSIATQDAIDRLHTGDRPGALAALLEAKPLTEELYAAFRNQRGPDKWRYWFRSGTNEDFYLMYNLYQKARLKLEVEPMDFVTGIEPQRHPYLGNVVMHDPAAPGDAIYSSQAERINSSVFNGAPDALLEFPLQGAFQIGGIRSVGGKWKGIVADHGLGYRFRLEGPATVYIAKPKDTRLDWPGKDGFQPVPGKVSVGQWGWPYRYQNRPPSSSTEFDLLFKPFPAGDVTLGPNPTSARQLPYIVFVKPASPLAWENFRNGTLGEAPPGWVVKGPATVVSIEDYAAEMRPSAFDLATVPRYRTLSLRALSLAPGASAGLKMSGAPRAAFVVHARFRCAAPATLALCDATGKPVASAPLPNAPGWQVLTLRISPANRTCQARLQDPALRMSEFHAIQFDSAAGAIDRLELRHAGRDPDPPLLCNAVAAWGAETSPVPPPGPRPGKEMPVAGNR